MSNSPFTPYATDYDAEFTDSAIGRTLRSMVWARLDELFLPDERILELGCGTGEDALRLAERGVKVFATDAAEGMIAVAKSKALDRSLGNQIEFRTLAMEKIRDLQPRVKFDGVFSNFGAVNCVADLQRLVADVAPMLVPGATLLWVVMGKHVPWEWIWYLLRLRSDKAFRRYRKQGVEWRGLTIRYPVPAELTRMMQPHFRVKRVTPLGFVLPPSYAGAWLNRSPRTLKALTRLETLTQRWAAPASYADHYMIEAERLPIGG